MKRKEWTFQYTASKLAEAAQEKLNAHKFKLQWWTDKKKEVMAKVKDGGIEVRDSVAASYSNTKGVFGPQIEIDEGLQRDLCEVQQKILEHTGFISEFDGWNQVLLANPESRLDLHHDDWLFFFGT